MKTNSIVAAIIISLFANLIFLNTANASKTYVLTLTVIEQNLEDEMYISDAEGDLLDKKNGIKTCSKPGVNVIIGSGVVYQKITKASKVRITNGSGKLLAITSLPKVGWIQTGTPFESHTDRQTGTVVNAVYGTCTFSKQVKLPKSSFYSFQLSGVDGSFPTFDYSAKNLSKMKWKLTLRF